MNDISLREYCDVKFKNVENNTALALQSLDKRLDSVNEFRGQLKDQAATFMTREYYEARHNELVKEIEDLRLSRAILAGKASATSVYISYAIALISIVISLLKIFD